MEDGYNVYHFYTRKKDTSMKYSFVDLDETLIHTNGDADSMKEFGAIKIDFDGDPYYTTYRVGAKEFLKKIRELSDKTFMLTIATDDYAEKMNEIFEFGFNENDIYSRYDIRGSRKGMARKPDLIPGSVFLFDNLRYYDNYEKINFLHAYGELKYIQVPAFYGIGDLSPELISELTSKMNETEV